MTSILLAGGGSAGHVSPMLALADALRRRDPDTTLLALGTSEGLESRLVPARGYRLALVPKVPMPRRPSADLLRLPGALRAAVKAAEDAIDEIDADVVVGMGGYVSTPAYLAARRRRVPIVVHEQNTRPGLANRLGARFTSHVATTFEQTRLPHAVRVGMPLRREISTLDRTTSRASARAELDLDGDRPTLLVTGGSLGAQRLNETMAAAAPQLREAGVQVVHLTGAGKADGLVDSPEYRVIEYLDRMELAYAAADLVLCRAGANTVCELTTVGLPAVYVPLPIGNGEQRLNAEPVVRAGGGLLVDNADLDADWVRSNVIPLLGDADRISAMAKVAAAQGIRDADEKLADMVLLAAAEPR
ncbi:MAG TPA: undecaprenyldiphospho-muramoylpentapeptide beta-N-acetylglucosaminyltransferase [Actinomycetales bacterium]|nr:undecaprenyldiphospho-muramoylpentapeptide beta-N-acetylglucosaminyltransferase [Actinomycetales bacterium]